MANNCNIMGVPFNNVNMGEAVTLVKLFLEKDKKRMVFTPNPEIVMAARKDPEYMKILKEGSLVVPDGIGVVIASKLLKTPLKERVAGYDLVQGVFKEIRKKYTVYFLGGAPGVAAEAKKEMMKKYRGLEVVGTHHGYFKDNDDEEAHIIEEINELKPDILLVGLGFPRQEKWIYNNLEKINSKVFIGVGGSFDVMSGNVKRAPEGFRKLGLEWFYRLITQPKRFFRMLILPVFLIKVVFSKK